MSDEKHSKADHKGRISDDRSSDLVGPDENALDRAPVSRLEDPSELDGLRYLRYAAGLHYTTDMRGSTLTQMAQHPVYGIASLRALEEWSSKDQWVERRKSNLDAWRKQIAQSIGNELTRVRAEQLTRIQAIFEQAIAKLENDLVDAKSWEGVAGVLVKLAEVMDSWRDKIRADTVPDVSRGFDPPPQTRPQLTDEEARAAATVIIQKRREQMRLEAAREKKEQGASHKPELQVIDGSGEG